MTMYKDVGICIDVVLIKKKYNVKCTTAKHIKSLFIKKMERIVTIINNNPSKIDWTEFYSLSDGNVDELVEELLNLKI